MILCVDIGGTNTKVGLVDPQGELSYVDSLPTRPDAGSFLDKLICLISKTREVANLEIAQLGVAIAGFLDDRQSHLLYNSNLSWLEQYPLRKRLQDVFPDLRIDLEIDSNAATMAEYRFGFGRGSSRFLCLTSGTGLGVGMTIDGVPLRFAYGCMGDIGHTVVLRDGPLCTCGGRGCVEALVSSNSLARDYQALTKGKAESSLREVIEAAKAGDAIAISILASAGEWLGIALASMANTFFPDRVAIAGGLSAAGDLVLKPLQRVFQQTACEFAKSRVTIGCASLGATATLIGAAWPFWRE